LITRIVDNTDLLKLIFGDFLKGNTCPVIGIDYHDRLKVTTVVLKDVGCISIKISTSKFQPRGISVY